MFKRLCVSVIVILCFCNGLKICKRNFKKLVIDNDGGADDALAIFMALLYEKYYNGPDLVALTTCNGNTLEDKVYVNDQKILKIAQRQDIPIYRGAKQSLITTIPSDQFFGEDGLGDTGIKFTNLVEGRKANAACTLIQLSKIYQGNLTVVTLGPLTNIAAVLATDRDFLKRIHHLYIGAGHIQSKDIPNPEFNALMDVEAYRIVMDHATTDKVTVLPFSQVLRYLKISNDWRKYVLGRIPTEIIQYQNKFEQVSINKAEYWSLLDPAVMAIVLQPDLISQEYYSRSNITLCGENRGITTNTMVNKKDGNVKIIYSIKKSMYEAFLLTVFSNNS